MSEKKFQRREIVGREDPVETGDPHTIQVLADGTVVVQDTGVHSNPEKWIHDNHWDSYQGDIIVAGPGGAQNLGVAVAAGKTRRIREVTIRHTGTNNTVITIRQAGGGVLPIYLSFDVPAQTTRTWSSLDGRLVPAEVLPTIESSDLTGGNTIYSASGVEE